MARKAHTPEEIVAKLRQVEVLVGQASRRPAPFSGFRHRLQAAGKSAKVAIITTARKLLVTRNAMLAAGSDYRAKPAT